MTIKLSANDLRLKPGEVPDAKRLAGLFEAIQTNFEQLAGLFPIGSKSLVKGSVGVNQLAAGIVLLLAATGTTRKVAFGSATLTWTASAQSATVEVTHALGTTPAVVLLSLEATPGATVLTARHSSIGPTVFKLSGQASTSVSTSVNCHWLAIG